LENDSLISTTTEPPSTRFEKGDYCIDHNINYQEGDQFKSIRNIESLESCRDECLNEAQCRYYVWQNSVRGKSCFLKSSGLWVPKYESGTISGTIEGDCKVQAPNDYAFCECVELAPDYYDEEFIDLVETGINPKSNICPDNQGKRCYSKVPKSVNTSSRIFFGKK